MLKRVKIDSPSVYQGKPDLDVFDRWALEVKTWIRLNRLSEEIAITILNKYLSGKASTYYMKYVAGKEKKRTMTMIFEGLFGYCFPKNFKSSLRRKLMSATQGKSEVMDFIRDIEIMADRFPDVNERSKIEIFWWGMHQPIRAEVLKMGVNQERSSLDKIVKCAVRAEDGVNQLKDALLLNRDARSWGRFANRNDGPKPYRPSNGEGSSKPNSGQERVRVNAVSPQQGNDQSRPNDQGRGGKKKRFGKKISRAKKDGLRAEGKCFHCEKTGHSKRDCPELNTMRPPASISTGSVSIARLERLSDARDKADLLVGSLTLGVEVEDDDATPAMRRAHDLCVQAWGDDDAWSNIESRWDSRYWVHQYDIYRGWGVN